MRLMFPEPIGDRAHEIDAVELPGMVLRVVAVEPLPEDREAWRTRIVGPGMAHEIVHTRTGWPLAIVHRDRTLLGFYELFDRGVVVSLTATDGEFDLSGARQLLQAADLDRTPREVVALSQLWQHRPGDA